jgi:hypothetical protein
VLEAAFYLLCVKPLVSLGKVEPVDLLDHDSFAVWQSMHEKAMHLHLNFQDLTEIVRDVVEVLLGNRSLPSWDIARLSLSALWMLAPSALHRGIALVFTNEIGMCTCKLRAIRDEVNSISVKER